MAYMRLIIFFPVLSSLFTHSFAAPASTWATQFSDAVIGRWPNSINDMTAKGWEYSNGIVLQGIERVYEHVKKEFYLEYIRNYVDKFVDANGKVNYDASARSLDKLHPSILCLFLFQETGNQKYKLAAEKLFADMKNQPVNNSGGFWHKQRYPHQMWCDGAYMALPFIAKYGYLIDEGRYCDSVAAFQTLLFSSKAYVPSKKLLLHGWDESRQASWADPATGLSPEIWGRAMGWFVMAMVEMLKYFPDSHNSYNQMVTLLKNIAEGIKNTQDPATGLWYQVMDKGGAGGNWLETSCSGMFIYALKTAVNYGFLDVGYLAVARKGWEGLKKHITLDNKGLPVINDFVGAMGIQNNFMGYVNQPRVSSPGSKHPHGYCGILMASSAMELAGKKKFRLTITTEGEGSVTNPTGEMFHDSGRTVTLSAVPADKNKFLAWGGDGSGANQTTAVLMNEDKRLTATFVPASIISPPAPGGTGSGIRLGYSQHRARITLSLENRRQIHIILSDCHGRKVRSIARGVFGPGSYNYHLNMGKEASGVYILQAHSGNGGGVHTLITRFPLSH